MVVVHMLFSLSRNYFSLLYNHKKKSLDGCGLLVLLQYLNSIPCNLNYVIISASRPLHSSYWCFLHDTLSLIRKWTNLEMCRRKQVNF